MKTRNLKEVQKDIDHYELIISNTTLLNSDRVLKKWHKTLLALRIELDNLTK